MKTLDSGKKRIMILGAGIFQLRLIRRARVLGFETHAVSIPGNYPGFAEADVPHYIDTTDIEEVVSLARQLPADAVVTAGTDVCVPTMGAICDALRLPGVSHRVAEIMSFKDRFRTFQKERGLPSPRSIADRTCNAFVRKAQELKFPIIVKPSDSSGSRGICQVKRFDPEVLRSSFEAALMHSRRGIVCGEEVLDGIEVGGNALLYDGQIVFLAITSKHMEGFIVRGHHYPTNVSQVAQDTVKMVLEQCCRELEYRDGALNFDVMVNGQNAWIIELAARLGGNGLTDLIERAYSYDAETEAVRIAAGDAPRPAAGQCLQSCGCVVFGAPVTGVLRGMTTLKELQNACPFVFDLVVQRKAGDKVSAMCHNADLIGYALFDIRDGFTWKTCADLVCRNLGIQVAGIHSHLS